MTGDRECRDLLRRVFLPAWICHQLYRSQWRLGVGLSYRWGRRVCPGSLCDRGLNRIPDTVSDEQALLVGDVLATGFGLPASRVSEEIRFSLLALVLRDLYFVVRVVEEATTYYCLREVSERARFVRQRYPEVLVTDPKTVRNLFFVTAIMAVRMSY